MRLVKALGSDGKYRFSASSKPVTDIRSNFHTLFSSSVNSIEPTQNIAVIKTMVGMAQAVCAALDSLEHPSIVGTIAGDDTIFVACRTNEETKSLAEELRRLL